jgi:2-haloacid dehalogenase
MQPGRRMSAMERPPKFADIEAAAKRLRAVAVRTPLLESGALKQRADRLGAPAARIAFQSSNAWDVHGAATFGMRALWINRLGMPPERLPGAAEHELRDLSGLPELLGLRL